MAKLTFQNIELELYQETEPGAATLVIEGTDRIVEIHIQVYPDGVVHVRSGEAGYTPVNKEAGTRGYFVGNIPKRKSSSELAHS